MICNGFKPDVDEPVDEAKEHGFIVLALTACSPASTRWR